MSDWTKWCAHGVQSGDTRDVGECGSCGAKLVEEARGKFNGPPTTSRLNVTLSWCLIPHNCLAELRKRIEALEASLKERG